MIPTSKFEILRRAPQLNASGKFTSATFSTASAGDVTAPRGLALGAHVSDSESFQLAQPNSFLGFLTRDVKKGGMTLEDRTFGITSATPVGPETPNTDGAEMSIEGAVEVELEGPLLVLTSGTGAVLSTSPVGSKLTFRGGKVALLQATETQFFQLVANNLTPMDDGNSELRIRIAAV